MAHHTKSMRVPPWTAISGERFSSGIFLGNCGCLIFEVSTKTVTSSAEGGDFGEVA